MNKFEDNKLLRSVLLNLTIDRTKNNISSPLERAVHYINFMDNTSQSEREDIFRAIYERDSESYAIIDEEYTKLSIIKQAEQILKQGGTKEEKKTKSLGKSLAEKLKEKGY